MAFKVTGRSTKIGSRGAQIGNQIWMPRNLNVSTYRNGDPIPEVTNQTTWNSLTTGAWCYYDNDPANGAIYGRLYNAYAVNDPRGLAPEGWHIPSSDEWEELIQYLDPTADILCNNCEQSTIAGFALKSTTGWLNGNGTNSSKFNGLPGGSRGSLGFQDLGYMGVWWTSTNVISNQITKYLLNDGSIYDEVGDFTFGVYIRLVKN